MKKFFAILLAYLFTASTFAAESNVGYVVYNKTTRQLVQPSSGYLIYPFSDTEGHWTATDVAAALAEMNDSINSGTPNSANAKVHWSQLAGVPAGFLDGTDDGGSGGLGLSFTNTTFKGMNVSEEQIDYKVTDQTSAAGITVTWTNKLNFLVLSHNATVTWADFPTSTTQERALHLTVTNTGSFTLSFPANVQWRTGNTLPANTYSRYFFYWDRTNVWGELDTAQIGATQLGNGDVDNTELSTLNGVSGTIATTSMLAPSYSTLVDGATITITCDSTKSVQNATVTLGGNRTLAISGAANGMTGVLIVKQDATGSRTLALPASSKVVSGGAGAITLSTTANAIDVLTWIYDGSNYLWTYGKNFN